MENKRSAKPIPKDLARQIIRAQRNEVTEYHIYKRLARKARDKKHKEILNSIAEDELKHYRFWMKYSKTEVDPRKWNLFRYFWLTQILGLKFGLMKMEKGENSAKINYAEIGKFIPEVLQLSKEESQHQNELIKILKSGILK